MMIRTDAKLSAAWTAPLLEAFGALGLDVPALCAVAGIDTGALEDPEEKVPRDFIGRLWRLALHQSADPLLGLHAGEKMRWRANHVFPLLLFTAETLGEGIQAVLRYQETLAHDRVLTLEGRPGNRRIRFHRSETSLPILDQELEYATMAGLKLFQAATTPALRFRKVTFPHAPLAVPEEYERILGCPVVFGAPHTEWFLDEASWTLPTRDRNPFLQAQLALIAAGAAKSSRRGTFAGETAERVRGLLPSGNCSVEDAAAAMHITPRTLQRRLAEEGTSFREVVEETRRAIAMTCLERGAGVQEMLYLGGYANVRALRRALARWRFRKPDGIEADSSS